LEGGDEMFLRKDMPEFIDAVDSVEREFSCRVDRERAFRIIQTIYTIRKDEKGDAFRALWDQAIKRHFVTEPEKVREYQLVIGRYFNARSVNARKGYTKTKEAQHSFPRIVGKPTTTQVTIEMENGMSVTFRGNPAAHHLSWDDVSEVSSHPALLTGELADAKKIALACMNDRRAEAS